METFLGNKLLSWLDGYKTYVIGVALILYAISSWYLGYIHTADAIQLIGTGSSVVFLRRGLEKATALMARKTTEFEKLPVGEKLPE